jgi:hypothetical protein
VGGIGEGAAFCLDSPDQQWPNATGLGVGGAASAAGLPYSGMEGPYASPCVGVELITGSQLRAFTAGQMEAMLSPVWPGRGTHELQHISALLSLPAPSGVSFLAQGKRLMEKTIRSKAALGWAVPKATCGQVLCNTEDAPGGGGGVQPDSLGWKPF